MIVERPHRYRMMEDALRAIATMDVYTRSGEKPATEVMCDVAKTALIGIPPGSPEDMTIDVITPDGIAVDIKDAICDLARTGNAPELIGRLVQALINNGKLSADDLRTMLPISYEVRK